MYNRKSQRLNGFNYYKEGIYFVTIITKNKKRYFGKIKGMSVILNNLGNIVQNCWLDLKKYYKIIKLMEYIIMPNHLHGLIKITGESLHSLSDIMCSFKSFSSRKINLSIKKCIFQWHKSFYDHIVRDDEDLLRIQEYIIYNPLKWPEDEYYDETDETCKERS